MHFYTLSAHTPYPTCPSLSHIISMRACTHTCLHAVIVRTWMYAGSLDKYSRACISTTGLLDLIITYPFAKESKPLKLTPLSELASISAPSSRRVSTAATLPRSIATNSDLFRTLKCKNKVNPLTSWINECMGVRFSVNYQWSPNLRIQRR